ncbi:hypothetical protein [Mycobacterium sp.]|uniref:hypothetical protein n=1 Tax=Mycobacterium sp. TaxID=1785 RepID=UPI003D10023D
MSRFTPATVAFASIAAVVSPAPPAHAGGQYVRTQSGLVRYLVTASDQSRGGAPTVACDDDRGFQRPRSAEPTTSTSRSRSSRRPADSPGDRGDIGGTPQNDLQLVTGQTLRIQGWTVAPVSDGTQFTNDGSGHGLFVRVDEVSPF